VVVVAVVAATWTAPPRATATGQARVVAKGSMPPGTPGRIQGAPPGEVHVAVSDFRFEPAEPLVDVGGTLTFDFVGPSHHTATDASGLDLYDSGSVGPGGPSTSFVFMAAGTYRFTCFPHPWMGGRVIVPLSVSPSAGGVGDTFTMTWAGARAPSGFVYDVQRRRLGQGWSAWRTGVLAKLGRLVPKAVGVVLFRARLREIGAGRSDWSRQASILVS
jgi:plastocyanin